MSEKFTIPPYQNGVVREAAVDETLVPQDSVEMAINVHFDRIGTMSRRPGTTLLGAQLQSGKSILGIGAYRNNAGTTYKPVAMVGTTVKAYDGSSWASVRTGLTDGSKARFTQLVGYMFMVNGNANEVCQTWAGSGSFGSTNAPTSVKGDFIENYRSRIWIAQADTDKLIYSAVVNTSGALDAWDATNYIRVSPQDGEKITGVKRHPRALLVFKQNHIYRIFSINSVDPDPSINKGTYSHESIVEAKDGIYYHHPTGFYKFVFDGEQEEISRPISDIIKAIPRASYDNITGWSDDDHVAWSIGDITLDGIALTNLVCRRTISTKVWTIYSYPNEFRSSALFDNGTDIFQLLGDTDGNVLKYDVGTDDAGSSIFYDVITHWTYLTSTKFLLKTMTQLGAFHENAQGMKIQYQLDSDNQQKTNNAWKDAGDIKKNIYQILSFNASNFTRIRFRITGNSKGTPFVFRGFEGLDLTTSQPK